LGRESPTVTSVAMLSRVVVVVDEWVREAAEEALAKAEAKEVVEVESRQREVKASTKHFIPSIMQ
jgi:hypothetical protein